MPIAGAVSHAWSLGGDRSGCMQHVALPLSHRCCRTDNSQGQLGDGTTTSRSEATPVMDPRTGQPLSNVASVSCGSFFTYFVMRDATIFGVGDSSSLQLGPGSPFQPVPGVVCTWPGEWQPGLAACPPQCHVQADPLPICCLGALLQHARGRHPSRSQTRLGSAARTCQLAIRAGHFVMKVRAARRIRGTRPSRAKRARNSSFPAVAVAAH